MHMSDEVVEELLRRVEKKFSMTPKVAIAGFGKSGKSSLFNKIYGANVASVSMRTDESRAEQTEARFGIDFTDTPGIGTKMFSLDYVWTSGVFDRQHVVIHVLNGTAAISEEDQRLHELLAKSTARRLTVVNKVDLLEEREQREFEESVRTHLGLLPQDFLFVSAKHGQNIPQLVERILAVIPDAMRDAFIARQQADLALKEKRIRSLIYSKATICAGIAAVPIPIADIFVITPIQVAMIGAIGHFHGVQLTKERALEFIVTMGAGVTFREVARQLFKLVPGYGSVISAAVAFAGTVALGEAANAWFKQGMTLDADLLREAFKKAAERAKEEYKSHRTPDQLARRIKELKKQRDEGRISQEEFERELANLDDDGATPKSA